MSLMAARFFQSRTGILAEYFDGAWSPREGIEGRICEPGHHFEWSWLLRRYARLSGGADSPIAAALKAFADRHGYDAHGFVVDQLIDDGRVHKSSRRSWPHTEAVKAEAAAAEAGDAEAPRRAARTIDRLFSAFLGRPVPGGWIDHVDASGAPLVDGMPASTLYHVFLAAAEADRLWGERELRKAMSGGAIRQAVILAGGKGTRLGEITRQVPKPMLPIAAAGHSSTISSKWSSATATGTSSCSGVISARFSRRPMTGGGSAARRSG